MDLALHSLFYYFCALLLSLNLLASASASCLPDQQSALLQLKESFSHSDLSSWLPDTDCCYGWEGVSCNQSTGHVIALDLSNRNMYASGLSAAIFNLTSLGRLNLANNDFLGSNIPDGFEKLSMLTHLNLSNSNFSGQIPIGIANLTNLITLDLSTGLYNDYYYYKFTPLTLWKPNLRTLISNLSNLRELYLDMVYINENGKEWCGALSESVPLLRVLSLTSCDLRGPIELSLSRLHLLAVIHLNDNCWLTSPFPDFFSNFPLKDLQLSNCNITGLFPSKIFHISTLTTLDISYNNVLFGTIPDFPLGSSLERLYLNGTQFSNRVPDSIGNLENLSVLSLGYCNFSGQIPSSVANLAKLEYLDLSYNSFSGSIHSISNLAKLKYLYLSSNSFLGSIPPTLFALPNLEELYLNVNNFSGQFILEVASLVSISPLTSLFLDDNQLNGSIPTAIYKFSNLTSFSLRSNQFSGPIPTTIFRLSSLVYLDLSSNKLSGTFQLSFLRQLSNLTNFIISGNQLFVEDISDEHLQLSFPKIRLLDLASCNLTQIPRLVQYLDSLTDVYLSSNYISGVVPRWLLEKFTSYYNAKETLLDLSGNIFTAVESPIDSGAYIDIIDLSFNKIKGALPLVSGVFLDYSNNEFSQIPLNYTLYLNNTLILRLTTNKLAGEIPSSICDC